MTHPQEQISVKVNELNGKNWELHVEPQTSVASFKENLAKVSGVPPVFQKLVIGTEVLKDTILIEDSVGASNVSEASDEPLITEVWESGRRTIVVTVPLSNLSVSPGTMDVVDAGLSSDRCLHVSINGGKCWNTALPCAVHDGQGASAKLSWRRCELVVRLPECEHEFQPPKPPGCSLTGRPSVGNRIPGASLDFDELAAVEPIEIAGRKALEGRLLNSGSLWQNLFWIRGLVSRQEASVILAAARAKAVMWDTTSADSVDGFPVFEAYLFKDGLARFGQSRELPVVLPPIVERLHRFVRRRYCCRSAVLCHALLRRYLPEERRVMPPHYDAHAFVTVVLALNPEEYDGGLYVQQNPLLATRQYPVTQPGDVLVHSYDLMHGVQTHRGTRYSLIFWFKDSQEACVANTSPWYLAAAEAGNDAAQFNLGYNFETGGCGCAQDLEQAAEWYERSAAQGNFMAMNALAKLCEQDRRMSLYEQAAELGSTKAMRHLARLAAEGLDDATAVRWLQAAAAEEDSAAICDLGKAYEKGKGVTVDCHAATQLFLRSAEFGNPEGQLKAGQALAQGWSGEVDYKQAIMWLRRAAHQGQPLANQSLGVLEALGISE